MLTAFVLICAISAPIDRCSIDNAVDIVRVPPPVAWIGGPQISLGANPSFCFATAEQYEATELNDTIDRTKYHTKPVCERANRLPRNIG